jgi:hypothetical protein
MKKMMMIIGIIILVISCKIELFGELQGPPQKKTIPGYPPLVTIKPDGTEKQDCGEDESLACYDVLEYPSSSSGIYNIGSKISIYRNFLNTEKGLVDVILTSPLNLNINPVEINYRKDNQTFITNDYISFEIEFKNRYGN